MHIRLTAADDLQAVEKIYEDARVFMAENGNPGQWGSSWPPMSLIKEDMALGRSYVCEENGEILAVFMFGSGPEPLYEEVSSEWLNDLPYCVAHRIATAGGHRGIGAFCLNWCFEQCGNLRIDTHRDNRPMQGLLKKLGFEYCGITQAEDGAERLAFQKYSGSEYGTKEPE